MGQTQRFSSLYAGSLEVILYDLLRSSFSLDDDMTHFLKLFLSQLSLDGWVTHAHEADEAVSEQALLESVGAMKIWKISDSQIDPSGRQCTRQILR